MKVLPIGPVPSTSGQQSVQGGRESKQYTTPKNESPVEITKLNSLRSEKDNRPVDSNKLWCKLKAEILGHHILNVSRYVAPGRSQHTHL